MNEDTALRMAIALFSDIISTVYRVETIDMGVKLDLIEYMRNMLDETEECLARPNAKSEWH